MSAVFRANVIKCIKQMTRFLLGWIGSSVQRDLGGVECEKDPIS